jgi:HAD superfamily hydrolase (TIGR01509 family)
VPFFDLVIFDCDGVLIDSERLAVRTEARILESLGWPLEKSEIKERFVGRSAAYMQEVVESQIGRKIDWALEFESKYREVFAEELAPVPGVAAALDAISVTTCVASSSTHEMLRFSLGLVGLYDRFEARVFSAEDVVHGKPAPDLFLHAAASIGVEPDRCAVNEDSPSGVAAGVAAGMSVFGFAGGVTPAEKLERPGVQVFVDMLDLPAILGFGTPA